MHLDFYRRLVAVCRKKVLYSLFILCYYSTIGNKTILEALEMNPQFYDEFCVCPCCGVEQDSRVEQLVAEVHPDGPDETVVRCGSCGELFLIEPLNEEAGLYFVSICESGMKS